MAQERGGARRRLAGRYGLACGVMAALAACALLAGATLAGGLGVGPVTIERAAREEPAQPEPAKDGDYEKDEEGEKDDGSRADEGASQRDTADEPATVCVHVDGAVAAPGVYVLPEGARANDAVAAAGGLVEGADTSGVNLAAPVADGEKVHVPLEGEASAPAASAGGAQEGTGGPVNINTAGVEELDELPGVGEATARAIVEDREQNGPFSTPEDLMRVSGIGEKKFERLQGLICV